LRAKHSSLLTKDQAFSPDKSAIDIALRSDFALWLGGDSIEGLCDQYCSANGPVLVTYMNQYCFALQPVLITSLTSTTSISLPERRRL